MILFDVNILIYAHREDQTDHEYFRDRLEAEVRKPSPFGLTPNVAAGFLRITTHPNFPNGPTPLAQALAVIDGFLLLPNCRWVSPGPRHWELLASLVRAARTQGKAVADAQHAAIALEQACTWVTRDADFRSFVPHGLRLDLWEPQTGS